MHWFYCASVLSQRQLLSTVELKCWAIPNNSCASRQGWLFLSHVWQMLVWCVCWRSLGDSTLPKEICWKIFFLVCPLILILLPVLLGSPLVDKANSLCFSFSVLCIWRLPNSSFCPLPRCSYCSYFSLPLHIILIGLTAAPLCSLQSSLLFLKYSTGNGKCLLGVLLSRNMRRLLPVSCKLCSLLSIPAFFRAVCDVL